MEFTGRGGQHGVRRRRCLLSRRLRQHKRTSAKTIALPAHEGAAEAGELVRIAGFSSDFSFFRFWAKRR